MDSIGPCPRCDRTDGTFYRCKDCGHTGCCKGHLFASDDGCWTGSKCPKCGGSKHEAMAYLSRR